MYHSTSLVVTACILALTSGSYQAVVTRQTGTAGCGNSKHFIGKTRAFDLQSNGTSRKYLIHLPNGYDKDIPTAALLAFHGRGSDSSKMEGVTRFSQHAINPDIIAIYPQGVEVRQTSMANKTITNVHGNREVGKARRTQNMA